MISIEAAQRLASVGPVMPVNGKRPLWPDWPNRATRSPAGTDWLEATGIGLLTGERAGYFVLDVDGAAGAATLAALEAQHGTLPATWTSHTGGGGAHLFFKHPGFPVRGSAGKLGRGLDVRGEGGQVVAPPSVHPSGAAYEWARAPWSTELAPAPEWLLAMLRPAVRLAAVPAPRSTDILKRASAYLAKVPGAVAGQAGHQQAWAAALAVVRGFGLGESEAFNLLASEYNPRCDPPWSDKELEHKVRSAMQDGRVAIGYLRDARQPTSASTPAATPAPKGLVDEGVADFFATAADKIQWALEPYIPKGGFVMVQGGPKSGKTWFAAWLAAECADAGLRVAVVEEEGAREVLRDRLKPFVPDPSAVNGTLRVLYRKRIRLDNPSVLKQLVDLYRGFDVIVLDPFIRLHGKKEQASDEMAIVLEAIQILMVETGAAVVLVHHTKKNGSWDRSSDSDAGLDDGRGSGVTAGEADNVIAIKGVPPKQRVVGQVRFIVENPGCRVGPEFAKRTAVIDLSEGSAAPFSWISPDDQRDEESRPQADPVEDIIEEIIKSKRLPDNEKCAISGSMIAKKLERNKTHTLEAVSRCARHGVLVPCEGRYGPLYFKPAVP